MGSEEHGTDHRDGPYLFTLLFILWTKEHSIDYVDKPYLFTILSLGLGKHSSNCRDEP